MPFEAMPGVWFASPEAFAAGAPPLSTGSPPTWGEIAAGAVGGVIDWGMRQLPARRPPSLPPAVPGGGAGVPVPVPRTVPGVPRGPGARGGTLSRAAVAAVIAAGGYVIGSWVYDAAGNLIGRRKRRRMNVLNPRALRRSMRRVQGFARFARKTITFTHRVKMRKRARR